MNTQDNIRAEAQKDPAQLEREIDQKRNHIEQIVQELGNKLSPGEMFDRALQMGKGNGGEFASNLGQTIKANPVPALLAATGLIWLYSSSRSDSGVSQQSSTTGRSSPDMSVYRTSAYGSTTTVSTDTSMAGGSASASSGGVGEKAPSAMHTVGDKLGSLKDGAGKKLGSAKSSVSDTAHGAMGTVRQKASQAGDGFSHMLETNPLAIGALGVAVGALLGAIVPRTQKEDELLGEYSDRLTNQARDLARQGYDTVASATREMTDRVAENSSGSPQDRAMGASGGSASASGLGEGSTTAH